jgi:AcrR family transcriptional regulator
MGLREVKKQQTRQTIADTALRLFAARGFDHVPVVEIAEAAGVSEKTVFNYFPTKEDIFFDEAEEREAALLAAVRDRQPGESILAALRRLQTTSCGRMCDPGFASFARIIEESPALRAKELEVMAHFTAVLAEAIERDAGVHEVDASVAASLLVGVHWTFFVMARKRALAGRHGPAAARRLRADLERAYALLERGLADLGEERRGRRVSRARAPRAS